MRTLKVTCDECKQPMGQAFRVTWNGGGVVYEGARESWDFCSDGCVAAHFTDRARLWAENDKKRSGDRDAAVFAVMD